MRTLKKDDERRYFVEGRIVFHSATNIKLDLAKLGAMIRAVDREFPWKDSAYAGFEEHGSIGNLSSEKTVIYGNGIKGLVSTEFNICPMRDILRKGQVYAYEKYINKLAEELAGKLPNITQVFGVTKIRVQTSFSYTG